jgi:hypothetical protein
MAKKDENRVSTLMGALNTDGKTTVNVKADSSSHRLFVSDGDTGTDYGPTNAPRDDNRIPVLVAISSVDHITPVIVYADSNGRLLIQTS